ncbi:acyltransferase [Pseudomonadales bacterium]|nr:acyltransferase [Pseudomonadales bacterium]
MKTVSLYIFLLLNFVNFQYVPNFRRLNVLMTTARMFFLRGAGSRLGSSSIVRPKVLIVNAANLEVGLNTIIGQNAKIMNFASVVVGDNVEIGPNVTFQTNEHLILDYQMPLGKQGVEFLSIVVGNGCYIGADVTILSGVHISQNCLIGAKSLVNRNLTVPGLYAGCPVKLIKSYSSDNGE